MRKLLKILLLPCPVILSIFLAYAIHPHAQGQNFPSGGTGNITTLGAPGPWIRLDSFGYLADLRQTADAVANSTTTITSATAAFVPGDTGKIVWVVNDSTHGTQCSGGTVTYVNSTTITSSVACTGTGSPWHLYIGTNDYNAWVAACNSVPASGGTIYIPKGNGAILNTVAGNPFCSLSTTVLGDVVLWGDAAPQMQAAAGVGGGTGVFPAAGYTYTNGGSGDLIAANNQPGKLHMWDWGIDGQSISLNIAGQAMIQVGSPDTYNFVIQNFSNASNSGYLIGWVGDVDNEFQNSFFSGTGFGGMSCNGFNTALVNTFVNGGLYAYEQLNGCVTSITGGVFQDNSTTGSGAIFLTSACNVAGLCKLSIGGNAVVCGTTGINAAMTNLGSQVQIDAAAIDTGRCSVANGTGIIVASTNRVQVTNTDISYTGSGVGVNNAAGGTYTSSGGNYSTTATGAGLYTGAGSWSLNQNDWPAPLTSGLSGFGGSPSVTKGGNVLAFSINVGSGGVASTGTITFAPAAPNGWQVNTCVDQTTQTATVARTQQIGTGSTTQVTIGNFTSAGIAGAWVANDILVCQAAPY